MGIYGLVAIPAYLFGGPLADRFPARWLMSIALIATAAIGAVFLGEPSPTLLAVAYGGFGLSTILLFWSAMIRVTHQIGGPERRGLAFGVLDAGRGAVAAGLATALAFGVADDGQGGADLRTVVGVMIATVVVAAVVVALTIGDGHQASDAAGFDVRQLRSVVGNVGLWRQGGVLLAAYVGYKSIDLFGVWAVEVAETSETDAARWTLAALWMRVPATLSVGWLSDFTDRRRWLAALFAGAAAALFVLAVLPGIGTGSASRSVGCVIAAVAVLSSAASIYAMRAVYFAMFDSLGVPAAAVGTAAGLVSMIGFLPDVFFLAVAGRIIDVMPDGVGVRWVLAGVAAMSLVGAALATAGTSQRRQ